MNRYLLLILLIPVVIIISTKHTEVTNNSSFPQERASQITSEVKSWSDTLGIKPPNLSFPGDSKIVKNYDDKGNYRQFESAASYSQDTNTITFHKGQSEDTVKHEYVHYLQDIAGISANHESCYVEAQAYTLQSMPIETIISWYKSYGR